jgi:hypothetical protein
MQRPAAKRGAGSGAVAFTFHVGRFWRAVPEHYLQLLGQWGTFDFMGLERTFDPFSLSYPKGGPDANPAPIGTPLALNVKTADARQSARPPFF